MTSGKRRGPQGVRQCTGAQHRVVTVSLLRWQARLPEWARVCVDAWVATVDAIDADVRLSARALAQWRGVIVADVREQVEALGDSDGAVMRAWAEWYHSWVRAYVEALTWERPELWWTEAEARERQSEADRAADATRKRVRKHVRVGARRAHRLLAVLQAASDQTVLWDTPAVARVLATRGPEVPAPALVAAADVLVRAGAAEWRRRADGRPWALLATGRPYLPPEGVCETPLPSEF